MRMRRAVLLAVVALGSVGLSPGAAHAQDSVRATGDAPRSTGGGFFDLDLAVQSDAPGGNVSGDASFRLGGPAGLLVEGPITCFLVEGDTAYVAVDSSAFPGSPVVAKLVDGG